MGECMVITFDQWNQLMRAFGWFFVAVCVMQLFIGMDFSYWEWRVRRHLRRKRLARIRAAKAVTRA